MKQTLGKVIAVGSGPQTFLKSESLDSSPDFLNINLTKVWLRNLF